MSVVDRPTSSGNNMFSSCWKGMRIISWSQPCWSCLTVRGVALIGARLLAQHEQLITCIFELPRKQQWLRVGFISTNFSWWWELGAGSLGNWGTSSCHIVFMVWVLTEETMTKYIACSRKKQLRHREHKSPCLLFSIWNRRLRWCLDTLG